MLLFLWCKKSKVQISIKMHNRHCEMERKCSNNKAKGRGKEKTRKNRNKAFVNGEGKRGLR